MTLCLVSKMKIEKESFKKEVFKKELIKNSVLHVWITDANDTYRSCSHFF